MTEGRGDDDGDSDGYDYDTAYDAVNKAFNSFGNTEPNSVVIPRDTGHGTTLGMARTKNQARAGREESA